MSKSRIVTSDFEGFLNAHGVKTCQNNNLFVPRSTTRLKNSFTLYNQEKLLRITLKRTYSFDPWKRSQQTAEVVASLPAIITRSSQEIQSPVAGTSGCGILATSRWFRCFSTFFPFLKRFRFCFFFFQSLSSAKHFVFNMTSCGPLQSKTQKQRD